jgi:predicted DNA-binding protein (UPF0251 family)
MKPADKRARILTLLDEGLVTQSEAAVLIRVTRQCIHRWVKVARIEPARARLRYLRELLRVDP